MSRKESQEFEVELARRAIAAAAERNDPGEVRRERLEAAADADGRLHVDAALEALSGPPEQAPVNPLAGARTESERRREGAARAVFPSLREVEEETPSTDSDADAGRGEAPSPEYEWVRGEDGRPQPMRVFTDEELTDNNKEDNDE